MARMLCSVCEPRETSRSRPDAVSQPWVAPETLLQRVPAEHPRLLFPQAQLAGIRATLKTSRREAFESLRKHAARGLKMSPPPEPDYDEIEDRAKRRLAYVASFAEMRRYHQGAMLHLALMYLMSGEKKYGQAAKALLLSAAEWDPEGISSILSRHGDEVGLGLVKSEALTYDWIYDLLNADERQRAEAMLVARADQMLRRLKRARLSRSGRVEPRCRLPGYLVEHAIALAEHPRAQVWLDYALKTILTVFPHWAGQDGGWAEGLSYASPTTPYSSRPWSRFDAQRAWTSGNGRSTASCPTSSSTTCRRPARSWALATRTTVVPWHGPDRCAG